MNPFIKVERLSPCIRGHKGFKIQKSNFETPNFEKKSIIFTTLSIWVTFYHNSTRITNKKVFLTVNVIFHFFLKSLKGRCDTKF